MNYVKINHCDIANGPGVRVVLWVAGCHHHCKGCHNENTWDFSTGKPFTTDTSQEIVDLIKQPHIAGLTISGGDPLAYENIRRVGDIVQYIHTQCPDKDIWVYTGHIYEELIRTNQYFKALVAPYINTLVDGPYIENLRDITLKFRGSSNQRIIDIPKSLSQGSAVCREEYT